MTDESANFCRWCGAGSQHGGRFCSQCGLSLSDSLDPRGITGPPGKPSGRPTWAIVTIVWSAVFLAAVISGATNTDIYYTAEHRSRDLLIIIAVWGFGMVIAAVIRAQRK
jgi:hypothetical protein